MTTVRAIWIQIKIRSRQINWTLLAVVVGCAAFILSIGLHSFAFTPREQDRAVRTRVRPANETAVILRDIHWAAQLGVRNRPIVGLKILDRMALNQTTVRSMTRNERDLWHLTKARLLVQMHDLDGALKQYNMIKKGSPFWLDAIEEKGEVTARKGEYAKALAILQTALAPQFKNQVDPHTFFVASLTHLRICDYPGVFVVSQQFKQNINARLPEWRKRAAKGDPYAKRLIAETKKTLHELQIIEADTIQRMALAKQAANGKEIGHITDNENVLLFPVSESPHPEVWRDELGHYQALMRTCPSSKIRGETKFASNSERGTKI